MYFTDGLKIADIPKLESRNKLKNNRVFQVHYKELESKLLHLCKSNSGVTPPLMLINYVPKTIIVKLKS